jgi:triphosphatase
LTTEFEIKLQVPADRLAAVEAALGRGKVQRQRLQARYFDTADGRLAAQRISLRLRKEGRDWVQTAKAPGESALDRLEHNAPLATGEPLRPEPDRHRGTAVGDRLKAALGRGPHEFAPLYATDVQRTTRVVTAGQSEVEIALDVGEIRAGRSRRRLCEIEFELKCGNPVTAAGLAEHWLREHGLWVDSISKSQRGQQLARGQAHWPAVHGEAPRYGRKSSGPQLLAAVFSACLEQVLPNASEIAAGFTDEELVHQLRVGLRRLRTALRELDGLAAGIDPAWEPVLTAVFRLLGEQRDLGALAPSVQRRMQADGGPALAWTVPEGQAEAVVAAVRDAAFQSALLGLVAWLHAPARDEGGLDAAATRALLAQRLDKLMKRAVKEGKRFAALEEAAQHRVRKRFKRLRYLAEYARPLFAAAKVDAFTKALKHVQDELGEFQDEAVAAALWRERAAREPHALFGLGWLAARRGTHVARCQEACRAFAHRAQPFWD